MDAFVSKQESPSLLQVDIVGTLERLQDVSHVQEEVLTDTGYSLDAVIVYRGNRIGVEVDGPSHFVGPLLRSPNGSTVLKHRQLRTLGGWKLVSIPYWEWDEICNASGGRDPTTLESKKQSFLRGVLDAAAVVSSSRLSIK
jgi:RAP domain